MSYYGYPNPTGYGANYSAYYGASLEQYQAAYNAAAYQQAMQQQQQQPATTTTTKTATGASISQPAQRYDPTASAAAYYASYPKPQSHPQSSTMTSQSMNKWPPATQSLPFSTRPRQTFEQLVTKTASNFKQRRPQPAAAHSISSAAAVQQIFYCDLCKVSCAGPQTYKEHLEGQKHKKREKVQPSFSNNNTSVASSNGLNNKDSNNSMMVDQPVASTPLPSGNSSDDNNKSNTINNKPVNKHIINCPLCGVACTGRDAYTAHLRGSKHQKTIKLHQKLGKPIPTDLMFKNASPPKPVALASSTPTRPRMPVNLLNQTPNSTDSSKPNITAGMPVSAATTTATAAAASVPLMAPPQPVAATAPSMPEVAPTVDHTTGGDGGVNSDLLPPPPMDEEANSEPVGREYIETKVNGKVVSFYCKLCDCSFNDPNAKDMHTKGKRHRLAYKKKVDPNLKIDLKTISSKLKNTVGKNATPSAAPKDNNNKYNLNKNGGAPIGDNLSTAPGIATNTLNIKPMMQDINQSQNIQSLMSQPVNKPNMPNNQFMSNIGNSSMPMTSRPYESFDDKHIMAKHNSIYPTPDEIGAIHEIVSSTEKALKLVSDQIAEEDNAVEIKLENVETTKTAEAIIKKPVADRALKGVMRVGLLAKNLLLRGDTDVKLIVVCSDKPTRTLLDRVHSILIEKIEKISPETKYSVILDKEAETIVLVRMSLNELQPLITCKVLLTSPAVRDGPDDHDETANNGAAEDAMDTSAPPPAADSGDLLNKQRCLASLAELRHAKWFQAKANQTNNCVLVIRIFRDLCHRNATWTPLSQWALELLVEKSLSSSSQKLSQGESFRRVLECISSGVLLPNGPGIYDPCELEPTDATENLTAQQREALTASAQVALRLLAFKQIYKILGMESLNAQNASKYAKKRQLEASEKEAENDTKKEKRESELVTDELDTTTSDDQTAMVASSGDSVIDQDQQTTATS